MMDEKITENILNGLNNIMNENSKKNVGKPYPDGSFRSVDNLMRAVNDHGKDMLVFTAYAVGKDSGYGKALVAYPFRVIDGFNVETYYTNNGSTREQFQKRDFSYLCSLASNNLDPDNRTNDNYIFFDEKHAKEYVEWAKTNTLTSEEKNPELHAMFAVAEKYMMDSYDD